MLASAISAREGNQVTLLEKNEKLGKKLYITGKGRCNVTNCCSETEFLDNVVSNPKFLTSAIYRFSPQYLMELLESEGLKLTIERGDRVFPSSNKASDVTKTLTRFAERNGVEIKLNCEVLSLFKNDNLFCLKTNLGDFSAEKVIVSTGGLSYSATGSTGLGYAFAKSFGHTVIEPVPSLCGIILKDSCVKELEGLALKNICASVYQDNKVVAMESGEMLFTSNGVSGPAILSLSAKINRKDFSCQRYSLGIDLKPALSLEQLDARLIRDFEKYVNCDFQNALKDLLPKSLISVFVLKSQIAPYLKVNQITSAQRKSVAILLKNFSFNILRLEGFERAVVTSGGVSTKEVNPKTMESKLCSGLFFTGETLDVDAYTGGYNLQIAFSTGYLAGICK